jgi:hypothetical protein
MEKGGGEEEYGMERKTEMRMRSRDRRRSALRAGKGSAGHGRAVEGRKGQDRIG